MVYYQQLRAALDQWPCDMHSVELCDLYYSEGQGHSRPVPGLWLLPYSDVDFVMIGARLYSLQEIAQSNKGLNNTLKTDAVCVC